MNLKDIFTQFENSAFRVEALPQYRVPQEVQALENYRVHRTVASDFNAAWAETVRDAVSAGKTMKRLRLLGDPLTEYEEFELQGYQAGLDAGEEIRVSNSAEHPVTPDFWLFDERWLAIMDYSSTGEFLGAEVREADSVELRSAQQWIAIFEASPDVRTIHPLL